MSNYTIDYYNKNAEDFYTGTVDADMSEMYSHFEKYLKEGDTLLDCGCGSGRDSRYFLSKGFDVYAIDASEEMCRKAEALTGRTVKCMRFDEIKETEKYDGIWACASLLHEEKEKLPEVIGKLIKALKKGGSLYMSFKYGDFTGERNGRYFVNMTEKDIEAILKEYAEAELTESWITRDVREGRADEKWINVIVRRK